ncbi:MAG TPA: hypothetical protein VF940_33765 [Streptosporangiaceae bacterium]
MELVSLAVSDGDLEAALAQYEAGAVLTVPRLSSDQAIPSTSPSSRNIRRATAHSSVARSKSSCSQQAKPSCLVP